MRKRRFDPKERTKSYVFLPPMLDLDPVYMQTHLLLNAYLFCDDVESNEDMIFLHYEYQDLDGSFARLENNFKQLTEFKGMFDPDKYTTIFYFEVPAQWRDDYTLFKGSKYSCISAKLKKRILRFYALGPQSQVYKVLYKDAEKRKQLEEELDVVLPEEAEVASALEFSSETYTSKNKIKSVANLDKTVWETT
jgi:hypothetical protein